MKDETLTEPSPTPAPSLREILPERHEPPLKPSKPQGPQLHAPSVRKPGEELQEGDK
jgi:hypothetical protein